MTTTAIQTPPIPAQVVRRDPDAPRKDQTKYAVSLMRRLWGHDPETCEELIAGLYEMGRTQLGRVIDNLMWTLSDQPRPINAAQAERIRLLWPRKLRKPLDTAAEQRLARMTEEQAQALIVKLTAEPDLPR